MEYQARPIANLGALMLKAWGAKQVDRDWINEYALIQKMITAQETLPSNGAKIFLELQKQGKVPDWVIQMTDIKMMELAAH